MKGVLFYKPFGKDATPKFRRTVPVKLRQEKLTNMKTVRFYKPGKDARPKVKRALRLRLSQQTLENMPSFNMKRKKGTLSHHQASTGTSSKAKKNKEKDTNVGEGEY